MPIFNNITFINEGLFDRFKKKPVQQYTNDQVELCEKYLDNVVIQHMKNWKRIALKELNNNKLGKYYRFDSSTSWIYEKSHGYRYSGPIFELGFIYVDLLDIDPHLRYNDNSKLYKDCSELEQKIINELNDYCKRNNISYINFDNTGSDWDGSMINVIVKISSIISKINESTIFESVELI